MYENICNGSSSLWLSADRKPLSSFAGGTSYQTGGQQRTGDRSGRRLSEDVKMVNIENGMLKGKVTSVVFKGVHYEIEVKENDRVWIIHSTQNAQVGSELGLDIYPEDIHIMRKVRD